MTRNEFGGDLRTRGGGATGIEGADNLCNQAAEAVGLGGIYVAWLSSSTVDARDRIADASPWEGSDGTTLFADMDSLGTGPTSGVFYDEDGEELFGPYSNNVAAVWTGTRQDGTSTGWNCSDWTSADCYTRRADALNETVQPNGGSIGIADNAGPAWTFGMITFDVPTARLYCLEQ